MGELGDEEDIWTVEEGQTEGWRIVYIGRFMTFTAHQILLRWRIKGLESVVHVAEKRNGK